MESEWKDTVICPYCGHDHECYVLGCTYLLCDKCGKPFCVETECIRNNDGRLEPVRTRATSIIGVFMTNDSLQPKEAIRHIHEALDKGIIKQVSGLTHEDRQKGNALKASRELVLYSYAAQYECPKNEVEHITNSICHLMITLNDLIVMQEEWSRHRLLGENNDIEAN